MKIFVTVALLAALPVFAQERRGGIAFHYATPLTAEELEWYGRFDVLVTHDPLPRPQVEALHRRGTRLALYEWAVAYYSSLASPWHRRLPSAALLNRTPLRGHLGAADAGAFYYDPLSPEHERDRARIVALRLRAIGYDGVFLDTTTAESVHPDARREFARRHPGRDYDAAYAVFLRELRRSVRLVITNQGYRKPEQILPYVDWDVSESLITHPQRGHYVLRPWKDAKDRWNSISVLMRELILPAQRNYPHVRFAHLNYTDDPKHLADIISIAWLYGADAFVTNPALTSAPRSDLYFADLGEPKPRVETADTAYRLFEHGVVAVNFGKKPMRVRKSIVVPPGETRIVRQGR